MSLSTRRSIVYAGVTLLLSTCGTLIVVEVGLRLLHGGLSSLPPRRYSGTALELVGSTYPAVYDALLGYKPSASAKVTGNPWGTVVTITEAGFRSNGVGGRPVRAGGRPIVALGDSFTFGDEVNDDETWPAYLERMLGRPVLNGGVFGYGFDQVALRAEQILDEIHPALVIVSISPDDIPRCEFSYRYAWKPYFDLANGGLLLRNVPVPRPGTLAPSEGPFQFLVRRSHLVSFVVQRVDPDRWAIPETLQVHDDGLEVSRRLVDRLARLGRKHGVPVLLVIQWVPGSDPGPTRALMARARAAGIDALDLEPPLQRLLPEVPDQVGRWGHLFNVEREGGSWVRVGHMKPGGNEAVARIIAERLGDGDELSPGSSRH